MTAERLSRFASGAPNRVALPAASAERAAAEVRELLARTRFAERVAALRGRGARYAPWPVTASALDVGAGGVDDALGAELLGLLHGGEPAGRWSRRHAGALDTLELAAAADDGTLAPGRWELTAFEGIVAARDRSDPPGAGAVYIGEDSLRFVATILDVAPAGRALEVGCGSGIATCALARSCDEVVAVDIAAECLAATRLTAALGGVGDRVVTRQGSFGAVPAGQVFGCVAANLPYVPVPPGLAYSRFGDGGPDGMRLLRELLALAPTLLDRDTGVLVMRFQALGDESGPLLMPELRTFAERTGFGVSVVADGRVTPETRSALTAARAAAANPGRSAAELLDIADRHLLGFGLPHYFACSLVARAGDPPGARFQDASGPALLDSAPQASVDAPDAVAAAVTAYRGRARDLPDGYWELGGQAEIDAPVAQLAALLAGCDGATPLRAVVRRVFAGRFAADPLTARSLYTTTETLARCLVDAGVLTCRSLA